MAAVRMAGGAADIKRRSKTCLHIKSLYTNEAKSILDQPGFAHTADDWVPTRIIATQLNIMQGSDVKYYLFPPR